MNKLEEFFRGSVRNAAAAFLWMFVMVLGSGAMLGSLAIGVLIHWTAGWAAGCLSLLFLGGLIQAAEWLSTYLERV